MRSLTQEEKSLFDTFWNAQKTIIFVDECDSESNITFTGTLVFDFFAYPFGINGCTVLFFAFRALSYFVITECIIADIMFEVRGEQIAMTIFSLCLFSKKKQNTISLKQRSDSLFTLYARTIRHNSNNNNNHMEYGNMKVPCISLKL